jgi:hypothetical protein
VWVRQSGMRFRVAAACAVVALVGVTGCASPPVVSVTASSGPVSVPLSTPRVSAPLQSDTPDPSPPPSVGPPLPSGTSTPTLRIRLASGAHLIVVTEGVYGSLNVELHDVIDVELVSDAHGPNAEVVAWQTPTSSDLAVLTPDHPNGLPACPDRATCTAFTAAAVGVAKLLIVGPMGSLCDDTGANCAAVAPIAYSITISVTPDPVMPPTPSASSPPPSTTPPTPPAPTPTPQPTVFVSPTGSPLQVVLTDADEKRAIEVPLGTLIIVNYHSPPNPQWFVYPAVSTDQSVLQPVDRGPSMAWTGPLAEYRATALGHSIASANTPQPYMCACIPVPIGINVIVVPQGA